MERRRGGGEAGVREIRKRVHKICATNNVLCSILAVHHFLILPSARWRWWSKVYRADERKPTSRVLHGLSFTLRWRRGPGGRGGRVCQTGANLTFEGAFKLHAHTQATRLTPSLLPMDGQPMLPGILDTRQVAHARLAPI